MLWCRGFKRSYDVKSATAMSSVLVSRTAMTKECDCYVIQNSDKATKRCHSFHPAHTDTQSSWTHDRCSRCFYNNYPPWKSSFINLASQMKIIYELITGQFSQEDYVNVKPATVYVL